MIYFQNSCFQLTNLKKKIKKFSTTSKSIYNNQMTDVKGRVLSAPKIQYGGRV